MSRRPILIVEDDEDLVACLSVLLEDEGYPVIVTSDGEAAIAACDRDPALVLIDFRLPGRPSGTELVSALRQRLDPSVRLVMLTGDDEATRHASEIGVDDFLAKPFEIEDLLRIIGEHTRD